MLSLAIEEEHLVRTLAVTLGYLPALFCYIVLLQIVAALRAITSRKFCRLETPWDAVGFIEGTDV